MVRPRRGRQSLSDISAPGRKISFRMPSCMRWKRSTGLVRAFACEATMTHLPIGRAYKTYQAGGNGEDGPIRKALCRLPRSAAEDGHELYADRALRMAVDSCDRLERS